MTGAVPFAPNSMTWILGIEDTCVYPVDPSEPALDEHELTEHSLRWKEDLAALKDLGATAVRYGVCWPTVHIAPDVFDWSVLDRVVPYAVDELELTIVADLVHYGTPRWLAGSFADPRYPEAIAAFAAAFASRYRDRVRHFTPLNEPVTTASFCGLRGVWPPALTGWDGWVAVAVPIALGMARTTHAIRSAHPDAVIVHVEAATLITTGESEHTEHADLLRAIGWLPTDLLMGTVTADHPMRPWLVEHGAAEDDLSWLVDNAASPDVMGVNYYPDLTPRRLESLDGRPTQVSHDRGATGLREAVAGFAIRYGLPVAITETSVEGTDEVREAWLRASAAVVSELVEEGVDLRGYTWWPMLDFVDWSWAASGTNVEEFAVMQVLADGSTSIGPAPSLGDPADGKTAFLRRMGLIRLEERGDGSLDRVATPAADAFRELSGGRTP
jgi:beta-glucosidase/6-phospho-beta-glucosidase/beta-galactosidase